MEKELRYNNVLTNDSRVISGYAVVFESESRDLGFIEIIHKGAITDETIKNSNVVAKYNHNDDIVLARSRYGEGTLKLTVDDYGVKYEFEAPHTVAGDEALELIKRGDIYESSFAFTIAKEKGSEKWSKRDGKLYREIFKINELFDISPVTTAAYAATSACTRKLEELSDIEKKLDEQLKELDELFNI